MSAETPKNILIVGAASAMAQETAKLYAGPQTSFFLVARNRDKLNFIADDLRARGAKSVEMFVAGLDDFSTHEKIVAEAAKSLTSIDVALFAHGVLGDQKAAEADYTEAEKIYRVNFLSIVSLLTPLANLFESRRHGTIVVISSVAGDRGRQSNYIYGSSKGALNVFLQGLRNRLFKSGVKLVIVKPGFVDTPMTADYPQNKLFVKPDVIARGIVKAVAKGKCDVYLPSYWQYIMLIIIHLPEFIFNRLKL